MTPNETPEPQRVHLLEEALQAERLRSRQLEQMLDLSPALIGSLAGPDHVVTYTNLQHARIFGSRAFLGRPLREALPEAEHQGFIALLDQVYQTGKPYVGTEVPVTWDIEEGSRVEAIVNFTFQPIQEPDGRVSGVLSYAIDVTEQVQAKRQAERTAAELKRSEARLVQHAEETEAEVIRRTAELRAQQAMTARILESVPAGIAYINRDLVYEWLNPVQLGLFGFTREHAVGNRIDAVFGPEGASQIEPLLRRVLETGQPYSAIAFPFTYRVGETVYQTHWDFTYQPVQNEAGEVDGVLVLALEVSERMRADKALRQSEAKYRGLFDANRDAILVADPRHIALEINPAFTQVFGYSASEILGRSAETLLCDPSDQTLLDRLVRDIHLHPDPIIHQLELRRRNGESFPAEVTTYMLRNEHGALQHYVGVIKDMTHQRRAETEAAQSIRELANQKTFAESLIQNVVTGIAYLDRDLVFRVANPVYSAFLEMTPDQIIGRHVFEVVPGGEDQIGPLLRRVLETGEPYYNQELEFVYVTPEGKPRKTYWDFVYYPLRHDEASPVNGIFVLADEISDRVAQKREQQRMQAEQERLQRERIEALELSDRLKDQFLSILSHELRTPVNAIMGFGSILDDEVAGPMTEEQHRYLGKILQGSDTLLALIDDLLDMSRIEAGKFTLNPMTMRFPEICGEVVSTLIPLARQKDLTLLAEVPDTVPPMEADPQRVGQVLTNLVNNAIKFTPQGGRITVRASVVADQLRCEVQDTGVGIAPDDIPKLFQRFTQLDMSATRQVGGTGLGLSISKALIEAHGGSIGVTSAPDEGSSFWFTLPIRTAVSRETPPPTET